MFANRIVRKKSSSFANEVRLSAALKKQTEDVRYGCERQIQFIAYERLYLDVCAEIPAKGVLQGNGKRRCESDSTAMRMEGS